jgi:hypothetical protein
MNVDAVSVSQVVAAPRRAGGVASAAPQPRADGVELDSVELGGKATGHARVAQNIERKVERLIAREVGEVGAGDAGAAGVLADSLRGIAAANTADPSNPSGVLRAIRETVEQYRAGGMEPPVPVTPGETDDAAPGTDEVPVTEEVPPAGAPVADLSALRLATAYAPVEDSPRFEWTV